MLMPEVLYVVVRGKLPATTSCSPPRLAFSEDAQTSTNFLSNTSTSVLKVLMARHSELPIELQCRVQTSVALIE